MRTARSSCDVSGEPKSEVSASPEREPNVPAVMPARQVELRPPVITLSMAPLPPTTPPKAALIPPLPGRAPPSI